jgi:hypothetical protein
MSLENPFENPLSVSEEKNAEIVQLMSSMIQQKKLDFFTMLKFLEQQIENKDQDRSKIAAYYCVNVILNSDKPDSDKMEIIGGIVRSFLEAFNGEVMDSEVQ